MKKTIIFIMSLVFVCIMNREVCCASDCSEGKDSIVAIETQLNEENNDNIIYIDWYNLGEGESVDIDVDGDLLTDFVVTCISEQFVETRSGMNTISKNFEISDSILGISYTAIDVNMNLRYYANGVNGYIDSLYGTATPHMGYSCYFDSTQITSSYCHMVYLHVSKGSKAGTFWFAGFYNGNDESASIDMGV